MIANIKSVTPEQARVWLAAAGRNRALRPSTVRAYASDMKAGRWELTGEAIKFDTSGALADGQHRLAAVMDSGVTVDFLVIEGLSPGTIHVLDSGAVRTLADVLTIDGTAGGWDAKHVAAVGKRCLLWDYGFRVQDHIPNLVTRSEVREYITTHPEVITHAREAARSRPPDISAAVFGFVSLTLGRIHRRMAGEFLGRWITGEGLDKGDPELLLRNRLAGGALVYSDGNLRRYARIGDIKVALAFRAWNAKRAGGRHARLQMPPGKLTDSNFPLPR